MRRLPPAAPACLLALLLTAGCAGSSGDDAASSPPAAPTVTSAAPSPDPSVAPSTAAPSATPTPTPTTPTAPAARRLTLVVSGDDVTGDTGTVPVALGEPIELTVTSDVADEVHVHGADVSMDVPAGGTVTLSFVQSAPGRFEVELESRKRVLTRLQVS